MTGLGSHGCVAEFLYPKLYLAVLGSPGLGGAPGAEFGGFSLEFRGRLYPERALPSEVPSFSVVSPLPRCCSFGNGHLQTGQKPPCSPVPSAGQAGAAGDAGGAQMGAHKAPRTRTQHVGALRMDGDSTGVLEMPRANGPARRRRAGMAAAVGTSERGDRELGQEPAGTSPPPTTNLTRQTQTWALQRSGSLWCSGRSWGAASAPCPAPCRVLTRWAGLPAPAGAGISAAAVLLAAHPPPAGGFGSLLWVCFCLFPALVAAELPCLLPGGTWG